MTLRDELEPCAASGRKASRIIQELFDAIVAALRRDPRFAGIPLREFEPIFADVHADAERRLINELRGCLHLEDIVDGVVETVSGGRSPKRKGVRVERELAQLVCELGLPCRRVPLSGAIGGAWSGDIHLALHGQTHKIEVKARREFRTLHGWLAGADLLPLKADRQSPLAVLPVALLAKLLAGVPS